jgi:putative methyltransferase (TIGR04325 family)
MTATAIGSTTKLKVRQLLGQCVALPGVRDVYGYLWFPRISNGFRGVFDSFEQAQQAIAQHLPVGYDQEVAHQYSAQHPEQLDPSDRPLLPHLRTALVNSQRVFDLGGSVGRGYYTYQRYVDYPPHLQWQVCEVPSAVAAGTNLAQKRGIKNLSFTTQWSAAERADVFITCGAIQYMQPSLASILATLTQKPRHLLIARVLCYDGPEYFTLQSILASKRPYKLATICPYKIQNRQQFIASLKALGYELVDSWRSKRTSIIPFHPQGFIDGYDSFYFRRIEAEDQGTDSG